MAPSALARPGSCANCSSTMWGFNNPTTSCLVGGFVYNEAGENLVDGQHDGQTGTSPAPFPFETEVLVTDPKGLIHSFQASVQGPDLKANSAAVTPLSQSLNMTNGELSTSVQFGAKDGSWSVTLQVLQFVSQSVPSLGLQQIVVTNRTAAIKNITLVPKLTTFGLPGNVVTTDLPANAFHLGLPDPLLIRSNSGAEVAMQVQTTCANADAADAKGKPLATPCISSKAYPSPLTMQSFHAVVGDTFHPEPAFGAVRTAHCESTYDLHERSGTRSDTVLCSEVQ